MFRRRRIQSAADPPGHSAHAVSRLQPVEDVYLLFLNRPPDDVPADDGGATVVPAVSLNHPSCPNPTPSGCSTALPATPPDTPARWSSCPISPPSSPAWDRAGRRSASTTRR